MSQESILRVGVDSRPMVDGSRSGEKALESLGNKAKDTEKKTKDLTHGWELFKTALEAAAIFEVARELAALSDEGTRAMNSIRVMTKTAADADAVWTELMRVSNETWQSFETSAEMFNQVAVATRNLGTTYRDQIGLVKELNIILLASGAAGQAAKNGISDLLRGMGANNITRQELRGMIHDIPLLGQTLADGLGVPVGALQHLASEGKLTAATVSAAFLKELPKVEEWLTRKTPTIAGAFQVMKNHAVDFVKSVNDQTGVGGGFARMLLAISDHFGMLAGAAAGFAAVMLAMVLPSIIATGVALLATPWGAIAAIVTVVAGALGYFGQKNYEVAGRSVSGWTLFKATVLTVWQVLKPVFTAIGGVWDWLSQKVMGLGSTTGDVFSKILGFLKSFINFEIGIWVAAFNAIKTVWGNLPGYFNTIWVTIVNTAAWAGEQLINSWQIVFRGIAALVAHVSPGIAKSMNDALDRMTIKLPRLNASASGDQFMHDIGNVMKSAFDTDYVGKFGDAVVSNIDRVHKAADPGALDRSAGTNDPMDPEGKESHKETRVEMMERFNRETQNSIDLAKRYYTVAAAQGDLDKMSEELLKKRYEDLSGPERSAMLSKLQTMHDEQDLQKTRDKILQDAIEPQREYERALLAISQLSHDHAITAAQEADAIRKAREEYLSTKKDLASGIELGQLKIIDELADDAGRATSAMSSVFEQARGPLLTFNATLAAANAQFRDGTLSATQYGDALRKAREDYLALQKDYGSGAELGLMQVFDELENKAGRIGQAIKSTFNEIQGPMLDFQSSFQATNELFGKGLLTIPQYAAKMHELGLEALDLNLKMGGGTWVDAALLSLGRLTSGYTTFLSGASDAFGSFFKSLEDGFADSIGKAIVEGDSLKQALRSVARGAISELISAFVKLGIQYVINHTIGTALSSAATAFSVAQAAVVATAWAPAAAMVSLASFGTNAAAAVTGMSFASAFAAGLAHVAGFAGGGLIGGSGGGTSDDQIIRASSGEFMVNAFATRQNRGLLEAINSGKKIDLAGYPAANDTSGGRQSLALQVNIHSEVPADFEVNQIDESTIEIIARRVSKETVQRDTPSLVASEIDNPNSRTSKALSRSTSAQRRRA